VQINFPENLLIFKVQNRLSGNRGIWKIDIKQCKITRWFWLEFASGTTESAVEFSWTLAAERHTPTSKSFSIKLRLDN